MVEQGLSEQSFSVLKFVRLTRQEKGGEDYGMDNESADEN